MAWCEFSRRHTLRQWAQSPPKLSMRWPAKSIFILSGCFWRPRSPSLEECVSEDDELSHDGCDGHFCGLSGSQQGVVLGFEVFVEAGGDERRHIKRLPDDGAGAANEGAAGPASGLPRHGGETCEACGLAWLKRPEFGHFDQQGEGGEACEAGNGDEDGEAPR